MNLRMVLNFSSEGKNNCQLNELWLSVSIKTEATDRSISFPSLSINHFCNPGLCRKEKGLFLWNTFVLQLVFAAIFAQLNVCFAFRGSPV